MAAPARIIAANIGSQTIGVAEFRAQARGGIVLHALRRRDIGADGTGETVRQAQITASLREMLAELGIKHGAVNYAVAQQSVFARFVKLPAVEEEKIEKIIAFEAQQNVPFPIDEVVWDYQLVGGGGDEQLQVVLVAIKADLLESINAAVESSGLQTYVVDVATMALYNAFRYNYSDLEGCSLLVDIGARTTNLLFVEPGRIFSRSVPIGGSSLTAAIAKEFIEPHASAEFRKKQSAYVSLGGAYADSPDADVARVAKITRSTMTRLHAEIMRSVSHYRAQQQGSAPARVFLCGGTSSTPYMREFFQEKLQLPTEFFNALRNVSVAPTADVTEIAKSAHLLGELTGLALRATSNCPMELNLRPASVLRAHELVRRRPFFIAAAACFILGILGWAFYYSHAAAVLDRTRERAQEKIDEMRKYESQLAELKRQSTALDSLAAPLVGIVNERGFWPQILEDLNSRLPKENIWITELIPTSGGKPILPAGAASGATSQTSANEPGTLAAIVPPRKGPVVTGPAIDGVLLRGLYLSNPRQQELVVDYFKNLVGSPFFAIDPNNQARVIKPTMANNTDWAFPYELRLDLKRPMPLP